MNGRHLLSGPDLIEFMWRLAALTGLVLMLAMAFGLFRGGS